MKTVYNELLSDPPAIPPSPEVIESEAEELEQWAHDHEAVPKLFADGEYRGYAQRQWAWERWLQTYGNFDSIRVSHAWLPPMSTSFAPEPETDYCTAKVMHPELGCGHYDRDDPCQCVGSGFYGPWRGMCGYCDWEGEIRVSEWKAVEDAHDHAWPGWRDLPVIDRWPEEGSGKKKGVARAAWWEVVHGLYPAGWVEQGGPIRTRRTTGATGSLQGRWCHPAGGWDLCGEMDEHSCGLSRGKVMCPGLTGCISDHGKCQPWPYPDDEED